MKRLMRRLRWRICKVLGCPGLLSPELEEAANEQIAELRDRFARMYQELKAIQR